MNMKRFSQRRTFPAEDGFKTWEAKNYEMMYSFLSKQYVHHCKRSKRYGLQPVGNILYDINAVFGAKYPYRYPLSKDTVEEYFRTFWVVSHHVWEPKDYIFQQNVITDMWRDWLQGLDMVDCLGKFDLSPNVVQSWFKIFEVLALLPRTTVENTMICLLSPPEVYRRELYDEELWEFGDELMDLDFSCEEKFNEGVKQLFWLGVAERFDNEWKPYPQKNISAKGMSETIRSHTSFDLPVNICS